VQVSLASGLTNAVTVAAGGSHTLALAVSGIWAWGNNADGQLGAGNTASTNRPILVTSAVAAQGMAAGGSHSLALLADGTVLAWGLNSSGQLGTGNNTSTNRPVTVSGLNNIVQVAAGGAHSLALDADGTVWAWGLNNWGQLGNNSQVNSNAPVKVIGLSNVVEIAAGTMHSLAKKADGTVWAWGDNSGGQMGVGVATPYSLTPKQTSIVLGGVPSPLGGGFMHSTVVKYSGAMWGCGDNILGELYLPTSITETNVPTKAANAGYVAVAAGMHTHSSLGLKADGTVYAWGDNTYGQLGIGSAIASTNVPVQITTLTNITGIALAGDVTEGYWYTPTAHGMALGADGTVWGWGGNGSGQIGDGTTTNRTAPVRVRGPGGTGYLSNVVSVVAGVYYSLALRSDGSVWAWGNNAGGIFGTSGGGTTNYPRRVLTLTNVVAIASAEGSAIALFSDGRIRTWGHNYNGVLGNGVTSSTGLTATPTLQTPTNVNIFVKVAAGCYNMYAVARDGTIWAWGDNTNGQVGDNTTTTRNRPVHILTVSNVVSMGCGHFNARAVTADGSLYVWGLADSGQLGTNVQFQVPTKTTWLNSNVKDSTGGRQHSVWLTRFGTVWASGRNTEGQAGNASNTNVTPQVEVRELYALDAVAIGAYHSLALKSDGAVWSVGANWAGQLGTGSAITTNVPVATKITTLSNVVTIATGQDNSMALTTNGFVYTWGYNAQGELGNGTTISTNRPIFVSSLSNVVAIASGFYHNLALLTNGTVRAWGYGGYGNLGDGTNLNRTTPVTVTGLSNVVNIAAGGYHNLALKSDGTVWAWGYNGYGQLGNNSYDPGPLSGPIVPHWTPTQVVGPGGVGFLTNIVDIVAGAYHSLALSADGFVYAWGGSWLGQVGNGGTNYQQVVPVKLLSLTNMVAIGRGDYHSMAMGTDGSVWTWGANWLGQLGDGTTIQRNTPVQSLLPLP